MLNRLNTEASPENTFWQKIITLSLVLFFVYLADAILSSWVPGHIEDTLKSPIVMGLLLSFSSIVCFGGDIIFPQILKGISVKKLLFAGVLFSVLFSTSLISSTYYPIILVFLLAMVFWGVFYEVIGFANHQFVADSIPMRMHASAWAVIGAFKNLAYFIGPLMGGFLVSVNSRYPVYFSLAFALVSGLILLFSKRQHERPLSIEVDKISIYSEIGRWRVLFKRVWPVLVLGITLGIIDAFFWTTGAVYTEELAEVSFWGRFFLPLYALPSLFVGFIIAKKGIISGKKKTALRFFLLSGIFLALMGVYESIYWQLLVVFCSSLALAISYPLIEGVYSDIIDRMRGHRRHMIGLCFSTISVSYMIGPIISGVVESFAGAVGAFVYLGYTVVLISLILMVLTPRKLKLPQSEIKKWKK